MASKVYTAQEMRDAANSREAWGYKDAVNNMLRQAADAMERKKKREKKREKKYEYRVLFRRCDGRMGYSIGHAQDIKMAMESLRVYAGYKDAHLVRREVSEWEEVRNESENQDRV